MATYEGEAFVEEAIGSVLDQRDVELELVVTDDGSLDSTPVIVRSWSSRDPRVRFAVQPHAGMAAARNNSLNRARGSHIALLDQDDRWPDGKLSRQLSLLDAAPGTAAVFGQTQMFGAAGTTDPAYTMLLSAGVLWRSAVESVGEFDPSSGTADDLDFLLRLLEDGHRVELEPGLGVLHRRHAAQASADLVAARRDCVRALARSLARRRERGVPGPLDHPLLGGVR